MAGTLTVQNIQGPTSGANANKIIVPSGQTLDVSAGTMLPSAGQIVQVQTSAMGGTTFSSGTYTDAAGCSITITPKFSSSIIVISVVGQTTIDTTSVDAGMDHQLLRDATVIKNSKWFNYLNRASYADDYYPIFSIQIQDSPSTTSAVTYKLQGRIYGGTGATWTLGTSNGGSGPVGLMTVMEIAQ